MSAEYGKSPATYRSDNYRGFPTRRYRAVFFATTGKCYSSQSRVSVPAGRPYLGNGEPPVYRVLAGHRALPVHPQAAHAHANSDQRPILCLAANKKAPVDDRGCPHWACLGLPLFGSLPPFLLQLWRYAAAENCVREFAGLVIALGNKGFAVILGFRGGRELSVLTRQQEHVAFDV